LLRHSFLTMFPPDHLYHIIRSRSGSKMLQQGEEINTFMRIKRLLEEGNITEAVNIFHEYLSKYENYESNPPSPISPFSYSDVQEINKNELYQIPYIYVHMLETLCETDDAAKLLSTMIKKSYMPIEYKRFPGLPNAEIFPFVRCGWYGKNYYWIKRFRREYS